MDLRPYQVEGVERILDQHNLLLAMVMGSGKTVTAAAAVRRLRQQRVVTNGAVFALKSTKYQWVREIAKVDPRAKVQVIEGDKRRRIWGYRRADQFNYTVLHYECLVHDWDEIKQYLPVDYLIFDEVTALKGFSAKRSKRAKALSKRATVRLGLSGQPVENRPEELFSLMEAIDPEVLGRFGLFDRTFIVRDGWGRPQRYRNLHLLQNRLGPSMYRKSREDIAEWLPEKIDIEMPVVLDRVTMRLHEEVRRDLSDALDKAIAAGIGGGFDVTAHYGRAPSEGSTLLGDVMSRLLAMRMLSSHPRLLRWSADEFDSPLTKMGSQYASYMKSAGMLDNLPLENSKLDALIESVMEILGEDPLHKVVIFSYFKPMIAMIGQAFVKLKQPFTTLTGDVTSAQERFRRIEKFNTDPACRIFLSSDAGAYGVDLNAGSHLVCYDLTWSAGALAQRVARIDRTSSGFEQIRIIYMYGHNTIEQRMFEQLQQKAKVARAFIDGEFDKGGKLNLDLQSLREFLDQPS
jgi:SNF2 family DNA or RNA helicase